MVWHPSREHSRRILSLCFMMLAIVDLEQSIIATRCRQVELCSRLRQQMPFSVDRSALHAAIRWILGLSGMRRTIGSMVHCFKQLSPYTSFIFTNVFRRRFVSQTIKLYHGSLIQHRFSFLVHHFTHFHLLVGAYSTRFTRTAVKCKSYTTEPFAMKFLQRVSHSLWLLPGRWRCSRDLASVSLFFGQPLYQTNYKFVVFEIRKMLSNILNSKSQKKYFLFWN